LSGNVTVNSNDLITQLTNGAELRASRAAINSNQIYVVYKNVNAVTVGQGNIWINGVQSSVYPINTTYNATVSSEIQVDGISQPLVCPIAVTLIGKTDANGNVTLTSDPVPEGTVGLVGNVKAVLQETIWYTPGEGTAALGQGFDLEDSEQVRFLKSSAAELLTSFELAVDGDVLNTLITEDGRTLSAEFGGYQ
jgi:hypothetical protein